jgi:excisionase family DNA binding protein
MDDLLSLAEAADLLGIKPATLRAAIDRRRFTARKVGNTWVTTRPEVERYRSQNSGAVGRPKGHSKWSEIKRQNGVPVDRAETPDEMEAAFQDDHDTADRERDNSGSIAGQTEATRAMGKRARRDVRHLRRSRPGPASS